MALEKADARRIVRQRSELTLADICLICLSSFPDNILLPFQSLLCRSLLILLSYPFCITM